LSDGRSETPSRSSLNLWALALLWFAGINLRVTLLAVPPLIPLIHQDLSLSEKAVGALGGLPVLIFGFGALFGALVLARTGVIRALIAGLAIAGLAGALRGIGPDVNMLFAMTALMGLGIAIMQPAMPTLVAHWFSTHAGFATATYVNGLLVGEIIGAAASTSLAAQLGSWGGALAFWSLLLLANILALLWALRAGRVTRPGLKGKGVPGRWWPDWRNKQMLLCGCILGCAASLYFTSNAFLPDFLHATGRGSQVDAALTALNGGQLPASFLLLAFADKLVGKNWPLAVIGVVSLAATSALALSESDMAALLLSGLIGFCAAAVLILVLALPPLLAKPGDVHHFSAGVFAIGYTIAFVTPIVSGALWDTTHTAATAFIPVAASGAVLAALAGILHISPGKR
jgi:CP family cyanate transporter-like MFS transporter